MYLIERFNIVKNKTEFIFCPDKNDFEFKVTLYDIFGIPVRNYYKKNSKGHYIRKSLKQILKGENHGLQQPY